MPIESQDPGVQGRPPAENWKYLEVPPSGSVACFFGGQPFGCYCHNINKRSKPCRLVMTKGALQCKLCHKDKPIWRGFTPLYDSEYCPRFVVITEEYKESVGELKRFQQVKVSRGRKVTDCVVIRQVNWRVSPIPDSEHRAKEPVLIDRLLILWGDPELIAWHYATDNTVSQEVAAAPTAEQVSAGPSRPPTKDELPSLAEKLRERMTWPGKDSPDAPGPKLVGSDVDVVLRRNGKHKPK